MKSFIGKVSAIWNGGLQHPHGALNEGGALGSLPYGFGREIAPNATHPSELIAAAHAASFSMTLSDELGASGYPLHQIDAAATVTMECVATRWRMTQVHLKVIATVQDGDAFDFVGATLRAKANCPVSRLLNANISMEAGLKRTLASARRPARKAVKGHVKKATGSKAARGEHRGNGA